MLDLKLGRELEIEVCAISSFELMEMSSCIDDTLFDVHNKLVAVDNLIGIYELRMEYGATTIPSSIESLVGIQLNTTTTDWAVENIMTKIIDGIKAILKKIKEGIIAVLRWFGLCKEKVKKINQEADTKLTEAKKQAATIKPETKKLDNNTNNNESKPSSAVNTNKNNKAAGASTPTDKLVANLRQVNSNAKSKASLILKPRECTTVIKLGCYAIVKDGMYDHDNKKLITESNSVSDIKRIYNNALMYYTTLQQILGKLNSSHDTAADSAPRGSQSNHVLVDGYNTDKVFNELSSDVQDFYLSNNFSKLYEEIIDYLTGVCDTLNKKVIPSITVVVDRLDKSDDSLYDAGGNRNMGVTNKDARRSQRNCVTVRKHLDLIKIQLNQIKKFQTAINVCCAHRLTVVNDLFK